MQRWHSPLFASLAVVTELLALASGAFSAGVWPTLATTLSVHSSAVALTIHFAGIAWLYRLQNRAAWLEQRHPDTLFILLLTAFLGLPGALVGLLSTLVSELTPTRPLEDDSLELNNDGWESAGVLEGSAALEAASLCDVFRHGTLSQRRSAVALIAANFEPELAEALRMALRDEHNAIRVQAGMVMQQLEDDFVRKQNALEALTQDELANHGFAPEDVFLRLATLHDHHAYTGLLDTRRTLEAHAKALRAYQAHLKRFPNDLKTIAAVGRLLIRAGQHELVADWLKRQVREGRVSASIVMWYLEALYRCERYQDVSEVMAKHGDLLTGILPQESKFHGVLALWREGHQDDVSAMIARQLQKVTHA